MAPQSLVICIDNSEHTRNGDFCPNRLVQEQEAANEILRVQLRSNPESDVALMTTAGSRPELLMPLGRSQVTLQKRLYSVETRGAQDPYVSLRIAQMVLKNRPGRKHTQRVVFFTGSPVDKTKDRFALLGKIYRKANVSLDIVAFGSADEIAQAKELFKPLQDAMGESCHLISVTAERDLTYVLRQQLPWLKSADLQVRPATVDAIDSNEDRELMLAIQMSLTDMKRNDADTGGADSGPAAITGKRQQQKSGLVKGAEMPALKSHGASHSASSKSQVKSASASKTSGKINANAGPQPSRALTSSKSSGLNKSAGKFSQRHSTSSSWSTVSPSRSMSKSSQGKNSSSTSLALSPIESAILKQILNSKFYQQIRGKYSAKQKDQPRGRSASGGGVNSSGKSSVKVSSAKANSQTGLPRWTSKSQQSLKTGGTAKSSSNASLKQKQKVPVNTQKILEMINSKAKSLAAASDSKVIGPAARRSEPGKGSSTTSLSRSQSSGGNMTSRTTIRKEQPSSAKIKTIRLRLVPKGANSAKATPSKSPAKSIAKDNDAKADDGKCKAKNDVEKSAAK